MHIRTHLCGLFLLVVVTCTTAPVVHEPTTTAPSRMAPSQELSARRRTLCTLLCLTVAMNCVPLLCLSPTYKTITRLLTRLPFRIQPTLSLHLLHPRLVAGTALSHQTGWMRSSRMQRCAMLSPGCLISFRLSQARIFSRLQNCTRLNRPRRS